MPEKDPTTWTAATWLLAAVDVSEQAPTDALDRLGLQIFATTVTNNIQTVQNAQYADVEALTATGNDVNKSKHPADIRTNAPSMYPGYQDKIGG